jgi:2-methylcitrate dehydratase PrpD
VSGSPMIEEKICDYIFAAPQQKLPEKTEAKTRLHLLDTLVAIISGMTLPPGAVASGFVQSLPSKPSCTLIGSSRRAGVFEAALVNGMLAHADETDDSHLAGRFHPGCAVVPAAIAAAEINNASSEVLLRAIALGYDIGARCNMALNVRDPSKAKFSTHCFGGLFGAAASSSACLNLNRKEINSLMSFTVQQASGLPYWNRDPDHIEKAFVFGGKGARDGLYSAFFAKSKMTSPPNPLTGERGLFACFAEDPQPKKLVDWLGDVFEIDNASIKKWCVGSPIQSVLDALEILISEHAIDPAGIEKVSLTMPSDRIHIIDDASMPTVCLQHLVALMILRGDCTFSEAHDESLMTNSEILKIRGKIEIIKSDDLVSARPERQSIINIKLSGGKELKHHAKVVHGTPQRPMTEEDVAKKATSILGSVSSKDFSQLIEICLERKKFSINNLLKSCELVS